MKVFVTYVKCAIFLNVLSLCGSSLCIQHILVLFIFFLLACLVLLLYFHKHKKTYLKVSEIGIHNQKYRQHGLVYVIGFPFNYKQ